MPIRRWREGSYEGFFQRIEELEARAGFQCHRRDLDRYLWLSAYLRRWRKSRSAGINSEGRRLFEEDEAEGGRLGRAILGEVGEMSAPREGTGPASA